MNGVRLTERDWQLIREAVHELRLTCASPASTGQATRLAQLTDLEERLTPPRRSPHFKPDPNGRGCLCARTGPPYRLCPVHGVDAVRDAT